MFHSNTEQLIDYWRSRRGTEETPSRSAINPVDFAQLLPQVFMLGRLAPGQYRVRLGGGFLADLHGRELRHADFLRLWEPAARTPLQLALEAVRRHPEPLVIQAEAHAGDGAMRMEVLIAPLRGPSGQVDRLIGLYQPTTPAAALKGGIVRALAIRGIATTAEANDQFPRLRLAAVDGRQIA
jgi:hypothetical protein